MKVVYVLISTDPLGGASKSFMAMLAGLMAKGVQPTVVLPDKNGLYRVLSEMNVRTVVLDNYRPFTYPPYFDSFVDYLLYVPRLLGRIYLNWQSARKLTGILRKERPDIIHTCVSVINFGYKAARTLHIPHIYHIREYGDLDFGMHYIPCHRYFEHQLDRAGSYSICITKDIQRHHRQQDKKTSRVIYNGLMPAREVMPSMCNGEGEYFLFAGRLEPAKGLMLLLEAYCRYAHRVAVPLRLLIAGGTVDSKYEEMAKKMVCDNGVDNCIEWLGERKDVDWLMRHAKATIIPSRFEGFGRVMPEAMFNGCLVMGRDTGGTKEQMDAGLALTGGEIALRFTTADGLAEQLFNVATLPDSEFEEYRKRAFRAVNSLYTTEVNVDGVYKFYKDILQCTI